MKTLLIVYAFLIFVTTQRSVESANGDPTSLRRNVEGLREESRSRSLREVDFIEREDDVKPSGVEVTDVNPNVKPDFNPSVVTIEKGDDVPSKEDGSSLDKPTFSFSNPSNWFWGTLGIPKPWWKGPNVCVERGSVIDGQSESPQESKQNESSPFNLHIQSTQCSETETSFECITKITSMTENKTNTVKYQCCYGFTRPNLRSQCTQVNLKSIDETLKEVGSSKLEELFQRNNFKSMINSKNVTIFSPSDETMVEYEEDSNKNENEIPAFGNSEPKVNDIAELLPRSTINGIFRTGDFKNDMVFDTIDGRSTIRVNIYGYPQHLMTANCARLVKVNNYAINGVIHTVDKVMPVVQSSIYEVIQRNPKFTILSQLLSQSDMKAKLQDMEDGYTLIAPTDEAFRKLDPALLQKFQSGQGCFERVLQSLVIPEVICKVAISDILLARTMARTRSIFIRDAEGNVKINDASASDPEYLTKNGIIYQVSEVPIPDNAKSISQSIKHEATSQFFKMANESGLLSEWDNLSNVTYFIPTDNAMKQLSEEEMAEYKNDPRKFFGNHIARPATKSSDLFNNKMMKTESGNELRISLVEDIPGIVSRALVQCNQVLVFNNEVCGALVHVVDKVITPPKPNIMAVLDSLEDVDIFKGLLKKSKYMDILRDQAGPFTVLTPKDESFKSHYTEAELNDLIQGQNQTKIEKFLEGHIFPEAVCCSSISRSIFIFNFQEYRTMDGSALSARRDATNRVKFSSPSMKKMTTVSKCDNMAANGIVHVVNHPLDISSRKSDHRNTPFYLHELF